MSVELIRGGIEELRKKLDKQPERIQESASISLLQHVTDCEELIRALDKNTIANKSICEIDMIRWNIRFTVWPTTNGYLLRVDGDISKDTRHDSFQDAINAAYEYSEQNH